MLWDGTSRIGSVVYYQCAEGYYTRSLRNYSVCGENGLWEDIDLWCEGADYYVMHVQGLLLSLLWKKGMFDGGLDSVSVLLHFFIAHSLCSFMSVCQTEISCGPPVALPHTNLLWGHNSTPGSTVLYECMEGFYQESGNNMSTCSLSGEWGEVSIKCKGRVTISLYLFSSGSMIISDY